MREWAGSSSSPAGVANVSVEIGTRTTVNASLSRAGAISGTITAPDGTPLSGVTIDGDATTESAGHYRFERVVGAGGRLDIDGTDALGGQQATGYQSIEVAATDTPGRTTHLDITLPLLAVVSGVVTARRGGAPMAGVRVTADGAGTVTGSDGRYVLTGLVPAVPVRLTFAPGPEAGDNSSNAFNTATSTAASGAAGTIGTGPNIALSSRS